MHVNHTHILKVKTSPDNNILLLMQKLVTVRQGQKGETKEQGEKVEGKEEEEEGGKNRKESGSLTRCQVGTL